MIGGKIIDCEQGSAEWHAARCGRATASRIGAKGRSDPFAENITIAALPQIRAAARRVFANLAATCQPNFSRSSVISSVTVPSGT